MKRTTTAVVAALLTMSATAALAQSKPLKLGGILDMSSLYADITGPGSEMAAKMAAEDFGGEVLGQKIETALDRLLDVILEHGDDQLVLVGEIRIERAAGEAGRGRNPFDAGGIDALFLEYQRSRLEQLVAGIVPGRSGSQP